MFFILLIDQSNLVNRDLTFYLIVLSIYVIAWLIGLYIPVAPAGIGVR